ncbi:MAG: leucine-rich repeat protein, partial [Muribaculaceae bacterium]|nr:leucine-rich repeat protein [Muribaculaceae bacterium]
YGYYPYNQRLSGVKDYPYSVERNQSEGSENGEISNYEKSDFLWGKTNSVTPAAPLALVTFRHLFAGVRVTLLEGDGFAADEWKNLEKSVLICSTTRESVVDLSVGTVVPSGEYDGRDISPAGRGDEFRAIVIPQTVAANSPLLKITAGEDTWQFAREDQMNYLSGRLHSFTIQVNKIGSGLRFSLVSESVTPWESDSESHNGEAKEYVIVNVPKVGDLHLAIRNTGFSAKEIENMKVTGCVNYWDLKYIRDNMPYLRALNLRELEIKEGFEKSGFVYRNNVIPDEAFKDMRHLRTIVLPENLKAIGDFAFGNTSLGGTLNLPASLEYIGSGAFGRYYGEEGMKTITGSLRLPSGLKYIGNDAFTELTFSGELAIPESVVYIGSEAFRGCDMMTGELHIPEKTVEIGENAFARMRGLTGKLVYPHGMKRIYKLAQNAGFSSIVLPEAPEIIEEEALMNISIRGDLKIPASVREIRNGAFENTTLSHIILPPDIDIIPERLFKNSRFLIDTITIPSKVEIINHEAFSGCENLNAVIIPKSVHTLRNWVFSGCSSLTYLRCDATEPPQVDETTFLGINKDNFTLEVPENSVDLYRNAPVWKEFRRISAYSNFVARPSKYNVLNKGGVKEIILNADA